MADHLTWWQKPLGPFLKNWLSQAPRVVRKKCVACGICCDSCPMQAITIVQNKRRHARVDDERCIRCYCCHELCPDGAVELRQSLMHHILGIGARNRPS